MSMKPDEFRKKLKGVINLVMTPFDSEGEVDEKALRFSLKNLCAKARGEDMLVLALGTTGEFYAMSEDENARVMDIITDEVNGTFPVIFGAGRAGTRLTIEAAKAAEKAGADAVLVIHPYYVMPTEEEVIHHYEEVAGSINIGLCIYNNSATSKLWLNPQAIKKLSTVPNIVGLKENSSNPMVFLEMMKTLDKNDISIFAGLGHEMYQFMSLFGCTGYVTEISNFAPELALDLYKAGLAHDLDRIRKDVDTMDLLWEYMAKVVSKHSRIPSVLTPDQTPSAMPFYQAINKAAMDLTGIPCGKVRAPMSNLTHEEIEGLKEVLVKMGCQVVK